MTFGLIERDFADVILVPLKFLPHVLLVLVRKLLDFLLKPFYLSNIFLGVLLLNAFVDVIVLIFVLLFSSRSKINELLLKGFFFFLEFFDSF